MPPAPKKPQEKQPTQGEAPAPSPEERISQLEAGMSALYDQQQQMQQTTLDAMGELREGTISALGNVLERIEQVASQPPAPPAQTVVELPDDAPPQDEDDLPGLALPEGYVRFWSPIASDYQICMEPGQWVSGPGGTARLVNSKILQFHNYILDTNDEAEITFLRSCQSDPRHPARGDFNENQDAAPQTKDRVVEGVRSSGQTSAPPAPVGAVRA